MATVKKGIVPKFFKRPIRPGAPLAAEGVIDGVMKMAVALENIEIVGGRAEWRNGRLRIVVEK